MESINFYIGNKRAKAYFANGKYYHDGYVVCHISKKYLHYINSVNADGKPRKGYHIHHCDFCKTNNHHENLVQIPKELHDIIHNGNIIVSKKEILDNIMPQFLRHYEKRLSRSALLLVKKIIKHKEASLIIKMLNKIDSKRTNIV